jgi:predicted acyltransferase
MVPLEQEMVRPRPTATRTEAAAAEVPVKVEKPARLTSLDAYRGFIMLVMASGGLAFAKIAAESGFKDNPVWQFLGYQFDHVAWQGCSFWDLIQPSFMFMVGVAMPFSYASRLAKGDSYGRIFAHVLLRSLVLILLGVFLSSNGSRQTNFTFVNVLTQIGLGYAFVFLLLGRGLAVQLLATAAILGGYWYAFYQHPLPPPDFDYAAVNASHETFDGLFAHWNKNANFASDFDLWFMNLFPRASRFEFNEGGYQTLNFIPSMATMLLGLMAGELLRGRRAPTTKLIWLLVAGVVCLALGLALDLTVCPSVKRIWTPSWALFSTGWTFLILAAFYWTIDLQGYRRWAFPLVVVGMNSIAIYCMSQLMKPWVKQTLQTHLGQNIFRGGFGPSGEPLLPEVYVPLVASVAVLAVFWLFCLWLYRQKIFVRI